MIHFPQLKKLSETKQERLAIELAFLIYGFLDPYGAFWRDIFLPRTPPGFLVVNALKVWLRGEADRDQCDRLARWMCEVGLFDRPLEDAFAMLWRSMKRPRSNEFRPARQRRNFEIWRMSFAID